MVKSERPGMSDNQNKFSESSVHHPPHTVHCPPSTIHHPPSTIHHPPPTTHHPRLLVSVRSPEEAEAALVGGADLIDVKEPAAGSLGRAADAVIEAVIGCVA